MVMINGGKTTKFFGDIVVNIEHQLGKNANKIINIMKQELIDATPSHGKNAHKHGKPSTGFLASKWKSGTHPTGEQGINRPAKSRSGQYTYREGFKQARTGKLATYYIWNPVSYLHLVNNGITSNGYLSPEKKSNVNFIQRALLKAKIEAKKQGL